MSSSVEPKKHRSPWPWIVLAVLLSFASGSLVHGYMQESKKEGYGGRTEKAKIVTSKTRTYAGAIDTTMKPNPSKDYVDVLVPDESGFTEAGFCLPKMGDGQNIARGADSSGGIHHVCAALVGYGSTADLWIYEVKDFLLGGKKVYHGFYKTGPDPVTAYAVIVSTGVDDPSDLSSFHLFGYATRGEKEPH